MPDCAPRLESRDTHGVLLAALVAMMGTATVLVATLVAMMGTVVAEAQKTPMFRTGVEQIEVAVIARDAEARFVSDLELEDFELYEDGKRQAIDDVALIDLPVMTTTSSMTKVLPLDVATNAQRTDGRIYLLVLDDLHVDAD